VEAGFRKMAGEQSQFKSETWEGCEINSKEPSKEDGRRKNASSMEKNVDNDDITRLLQGSPDSSID
jgi:hypothetical protein